jgi:hypothetical protein
MHHVEKDPRHDVEQEIPPDRVRAQAQHLEQQVEDGDEDHRLQDVLHDGHHGVRVGLANVPHRVVVDQFDNADRRLDA